jgi:Phage terminase-like protein, large subunit
MLSNVATPKYYGEFRERVLSGELPVCKNIEMQMNRIDDRIANPAIYYDSNAVEGIISFCEKELTLTDGSSVHLTDTFKLWLEDIFGWYYYQAKTVIVPDPDTILGHRYETIQLKRRLVTKIFLIVGRGSAKSLFDEFIHAYGLIIDRSTTHQITTAPTMKQADEVMAPFATAIIKSRGPVFKFMTEGSIQNTTGSKALRPKLFSSKKGIENTLTNSLLEIRPMSISKLQGLRVKYATIDEWLSGDTREDVIGAIEQGASKNR